MISSILLIAALINLAIVISKTWYAKDPINGVAVSLVILVLCLANLIVVLSS